MKDKIYIKVGDFYSAKGRYLKIRSVEIMDHQWKAYAQIILSPNLNEVGRFIIEIGTIHVRYKLETYIRV